MPFSHHSHSGQFCGHAKNTLEEMILAAKKKSFHTLAMTEHMPRDETCDLYPEEVELGYTVLQLYKIFDDYYAEATRLREEYNDQLRLLVGFECDWIRPSSEHLINSLLDRHRFDLFIGSVHHVHTVPIDYDQPLYNQARDLSGGTDEKLFQDYFDLQFEMLKALKPPIVGHFDLIRLKSDDPNGSFQQWQGVWQRIVRNLDFIAQYGGIIELNSAALRKGMSEPYPKAEICGVFLQRGGRFTLSDDSHGVDQIGYGFEEVLDYGEKLGIQTLAVLEKGTATLDARFPGVSAVHINPKQPRSR